MKKFLKKVKVLRQGNWRWQREALYVDTEGNFYNEVFVTHTGTFFVPCDQDGKHAPWPFASRVRAEDVIVADDFDSPLVKIVEAAIFLMSPEGRKKGSGAMHDLKAAVAACNEAQASE